MGTAVEYIPQPLTQAAWDALLLTTPLDTDSLTEGVVNLYDTGAPPADTDALPEGVVNLYDTGVQSKIEDADSDTKVDVEEAADEDQIRMDVAGVEVFRLHNDGILDLAKQSRMAVHRNVDQAINTATWTKVNFNIELFDNQNEYDPVTNYRFTAKKSGYYFISFSVVILLSVADKRVLLKLMKNGAQLHLCVYHTSHLQDITAGIISVVAFLAANDFVDGQTYQESGVAKNLSGDSAHSFLHIHKLS